MLINLLNLTKSPLLHKSRELTLVILIFQNFHMRFVSRLLQSVSVTFGNNANSNDGDSRPLGDSHLMTKPKGVRDYGQELAHCRNDRVRKGLEPKFVNKSGRISDLAFVMKIKSCPIAE